MFRKFILGKQGVETTGFLSPFAEGLGVAHPWVNAMFGPTVALENVGASADFA